MATILGQNQYGKAENRVVKITRDGDTHHIKDLNVSVALSGDMDDVHYSGSNANVLPTDTTKNTVYAFAKEHGIESAEQFGIHLARWFVTSQEPIQKARIRIEEYSWSRIATSDANSKFIGADEVNHSFVREGQETRVTQITYDGKNWEVISGLKDLVVMNSTNSEFWGYVKDKYTTLKEAYDRILATQVSARWRFNWSDDEQRMPNWEKSYAETRKHMLQSSRRPTPFRCSRPCTRWVRASSTTVRRSTRSASRSRTSTTSSSTSSPSVSRTTTRSTSPRTVRTV